ncbi:MAG: flagellar biosynthesis protein FliQ [Firmicutes bacterium]|nr:flagellar biosynthesis protein FliQ [Bacillota bacterium]MDH7495385.1 flagellar biosynthesis protein FliQ [Bacillota bacterium]
MTEEVIAGIGQRAIFVTLEVAAPVLLFALVAGLLVSIFQAVTQIQEMTLALVPKILAVILALVVFGPWMMRMLVEFTRELFTNLPNYVL